MRRLRLLLCDDEPLILTWLQSVLEPEFAVVGTAEDGDSLIAAAHALRPDVIVTEIDLPCLNGIAAVQELRQPLPACRVIFHTSRREPEVMAAAFVAGAVGYLIKGDAPSLRESIRTVVKHLRDHNEELVAGWVN
ncbi:MAG: response regulator transcription factor [Nitrospira sp.]